MSWEKQSDLTSNTSKFLQMLAILNNVLKPNLVQRQSRSKVCNILATLSPLYGYEIWAETEI